MNRVYSYCCFCGANFSQQSLLDRQCLNCREIFFQNPAPVAVILVPVDGGLLLIKRGIEPRKGLWALPGGYVDNRETWQQAGAREVYEEAGIKIDPTSIKPIEVLSTPDFKTILLFGLAQEISKVDLPEFVASTEAIERTIVWESPELAFPYHTQVARWFFEGKFSCRI